MKKLKGFLIPFCVHIVVYIVMTLLWIVSFHTPLLGGIEVYFYRGLALLVIFGLLGTIIIAFLRRLPSLTLVGRDIFLQLVIFCCVNTVIFTHLPVTAERSVTVFMLGTFAERQEEGLSEEEMKAWFEKRYVDDFGAMGKRLREQEVTGTVAQGEDGRYRITQKGGFLMKIYELVAKWFDVNDRLIHPGEDGSAG